MQEEILENHERANFGLQQLASTVPENSPFTKRHGRLLSLVTSSPDEDMVKVLFQFFDPLHHSFTFPDYQLVPIIEEFSQLLGVPILNQSPFNGMERDPKPKEISQALYLQRPDVVANWETRSGIKEFLAKFLLEKAHYFWDTLDLQAFEEVLAFLIYGMVLFPNTDQLIDVKAVKIFLSHNSVPTLLGDILHSFHTHTFGYARRDGPHDVLVQGIMFNYEGDVQGYRQRFIRAWGMVNKVDSKILGHKNSIPLDPYLKWVRARA
ncbi:unnamed protein product [Vicia faba]|uniref:DUF7745 domain-containing protein n=1 Tax=Vicia faba TaxID=3906 RepID=A0AAV0YKG5_VICFA|nr:unnamed protein product [Vicia faba]